MRFSENRFIRLERNAQILKVIGHPLRLAIIELLTERQRMTVTEIFNELGIEQAVASHHLRLLRSSKLVSLTKSGKHSLYFITEKRVSDIINIFEE